MPTATAPPQIDLQLLPNGHLLLADARAAGVAAKVGKAFAASTPAGLLSLATDALSDDGLAPALRYWRGFAQRYLTELCQSTETEWRPVPVLEFEELARMVTGAPPAPGMEYLSVDRLEEIWSSLDAHVGAEIAASERPLAEWLTRRNPLWRLVGRVTFHLAENRRNELFPFAFLATYTHQISSQSQLQYLPLGKALQEYAGKKNTRALQSLLSPVQAAAERDGFARELLDTRKVFHALAWSPAEAHRFLQSAGAFEDAGLIVKVPDWWKSGRPSRATVNVSVDRDDKTSVGLDSLLSFKASVALDGENISEAEWEQILAAPDNLVRLKGRWVEVDKDKLQQVLAQWKQAESAAASGELSFLQGMRLLAGFELPGGSGIDGLDAALAADGGWTTFSAGGELRKWLEQVRDPESLKDVKLGRALRATLRPYQQAGLNWLALMSRLRLGACLADDMGLGKTVQVIGLLLQIRKLDRARELPPSLLVVPASLVGNWRAEIEKFAPSLEIFYAHPSQCERDELDDIIGNGAAADAVITTYSMLGRIAGLVDLDWNVLVLDEAQAIKNPGTKQTKLVKSLDAQVRIAMTGTPIENSVGDLWSLFDFINPGLLGTAPAFGKAMKSKHAYSGLRRLVGPYILRRLKTDKSIISDLPDKTELRTDCPLSRSQATLYRRSVEQLKKDLDAPDIEPFQRSGLVLTYLMRFKQICNHVALWTGSGNFASKDSGKFRRLQAICEELDSRGEKALVFTQFREMTAPISEFLEGVFGRGGLVLHGGTAVKRRQKLVEQFQSDAGPPFFVISLKAGGTGLNLTAASHVIHFDRWWNPAVEDQATDRAFRIGQKRNVLVHKFVCAGTVEEKIDQLIADKREIADEVLAQGAEKLISDMDDDELMNFVALDLDKAVF